MTKKAVEAIAQAAAVDYERRLADAFQECIDVWNRAEEEDRDVYPTEVAGIGDIIRGQLARVPWVEVDTTPVQGPPYKQSDKNDTPLAAESYSESP